MANVQNPHDADKRAEVEMLRAIVCAAITTLDHRVGAAALDHIARSRGADEGRLIELERAIAAVEALDDAAAALAMRCTPTPARAALVGMESAAREFSEASSAFFALSMRLALGGEDGGLVNEADQRALDRARRAAADFEPLRRRAAEGDSVPVATAASDRSEQRAWLNAIAQRADADQRDPGLRAALVFLSVATVAQWADGVEWGESIAHGAFLAALEGMERDDSGAAMVRRSLVALRHRPDNFAAGDRTARNKARRAADLERWRTVSPARFAREVQRAIDAGGGVTGAAARALGVASVDVLRALVEGAPVPGAERPKAS